MPNWTGMKVFLSPSEQERNERRRAEAARKEQRRDQPVLVRLGAGHVYDVHHNEPWLSAEVWHLFNGVCGRLRMPVGGYLYRWMQPGNDVLVLDGWIEWDEPEEPKRFIGIMGDHGFIPYGDTMST